MKVDELVVVDVDLDIAPQCEHSYHAGKKFAHEGDAKYVINISCEPCGHGRSMLICKSGFDRAKANLDRLKCPSCRDFTPIELAWRVVSVL